MPVRQVRAILREKFGARKYRITATGEIHAYGPMPNASCEGWYLVGWIGHAETEARLRDWL